MTKEQRREQKRAYAAEWAGLRRSIRLLQQAGEYYAAAVLRKHLNLTYRCWRDL